jgi:hypothetical protein
VNESLLVSAQKAGNQYFNAKQTAFVIQIEIYWKKSGERFFKDIQLIPD